MSDWKYLGCKSGLPFRLENPRNSLKSENAITNKSVGIEIHSGLWPVGREESADLCVQATIKPVACHHCTAGHVCTDSIQIHCV